MSGGREEEVEERKRQRKLEEALEVKSLRRIISAYLNYPEAAEENVKRYERSYSKLPAAHKALLSHFPLKFERLRRCISMNSYFIFTMLQAFEPPLDMSQDTDFCDDPHLGHTHNEQLSSRERNFNDHVFSSERSFFPGEPTSTSGRIRSLESDKICCSEGGAIFSNSPKPPIIDKVSSSAREWLDPSLQLSVPLVDVDKVRCVIRNIVRDWAAEGQKEREQCYRPILEELQALFPHRDKESPPACLVPGAGLGRLALEISCLGFISQGNEFSYYMMICSSFILNHSQNVGEWTIYPWLHSNINSLSDSDQLRPVSIPDILPASAGITEGFSMCAGDFVEVYSDPSQEGMWDAVVTCFFIDTAHNIIEYIEVISRILKDGGVWINLGPLLYHFADMYGQEDEMSIEPSLEDVKSIILHYGFEFEKERTVKTTYSTNARSMMQNRYYAAFWTMRKKSATTQDTTH